MSDAQDQKQAAPKRARKGRAASDAAGDGEDATTAEQPPEAQPCMPCHGTGKVISNLGGSPRKVTCPWCRGGGERLTGVDAQEFYAEQQSALKSR
jgi:hypothetical protein